MVFRHRFALTGRWRSSFRRARVTGLCRPPTERQLRSPLSLPTRLSAGLCGRHLAYNALELCGYARLVACTAEADPVAFGVPLPVTFEIEVAFPSVAHVVLGMSLEGIGAPEGFCCIVGRINRFVAAYSTIGGGCAAFFSLFASASFKVVR